MFFTQIENKRVVVHYESVGYGWFPAWSVAHLLVASVDGLFH